MDMKIILLAAATVGIIALPVQAKADDAKAPVAKTAETHAAAMFDKIDTNHDGKISHDEWNKWRAEEEKEDKEESAKSGK